jgi:hypothetical protein
VLSGETDGAGDGIEAGGGGGRRVLVKRRRHGRRHELGKGWDHARKARDAQPAWGFTLGTHHRAVIERHRDRAPEDPDGQQRNDDDEPKAHRAHTVPDAFPRVKDSTLAVQRHPSRRQPGCSAVYAGRWRTRQAIHIYGALLFL